MNTRQSLEIERQRLSERLAEQPGGRVFAPLADCHRKLGDLEEALEICLTGLSRHPDYSSAHVILGKIHLERGDESAAREAFEKVLELDSQNLLALRQLAELAESSGEYDEARDRWTQVAALELDPSYAEERLESLPAKGAASEEDATADETPEAEAEEAPIPVDVIEETQEVREADETREAEVETEILDEETETPEAETEIPEQESPAPVEASTTADDEGEVEAPTAPDQDESEAVTPEVVPPSPVAAAAAPTAEIATMTLAEIYAEQGFEAKALDIYRQILQRNPHAPGVQDRIDALQGRAAAGPAPQEAPLGAPVTADGANGVSSRTDVRPSDPIEAPVNSPRAGGAEQERFNHFRSWLDRIRVDED